MFVALLVGVRTERKQCSTDPAVDDEIVTFVPNRPDKQIKRIYRRSQEKDGL